MNDSSSEFSLAQLWRRVDITVRSLVFFFFTLVLSRCYCTSSGQVVVKSCPAVFLPTL